MTDFAVETRTINPGELASTDGNLSRVEIAKLKALLTSKKKWWKDPPLCISILAFLLSLGTSAVSIYTNRQKDLHDQQAELSSAIRLIQELNVKTLEIREKYKGTPDEGQASGLINNQNS